MTNQSSEVLSQVTGYAGERSVHDAPNTSEVLMTTPTTPEGRRELKALAEKATPGPWYQSGSPWFQTGGFVLAGSPDPHAGTVLADLTDTWEEQRSDDGLDADHERDPDDDAAFIAAANPATVLSLLAALEEAEGRAGKAEEDLSVIHRAAAHCCGRFGGRMSEVDRIFQEITRVSGMFRSRAALTTKSGEASDAS